MSTTTDQRDELAEALKEAIELLKTRRKEIVDTGKYHAKINGDSKTNWIEWLDDGPEYWEINDFIEKWKT